MNSKGKKKVNKVDYIPDDMRAKLGKRLRDLRIQRGYSNYDDFAYENDFSRAQVGRYENGQDMRFSSLIKMLNALNISIEEFFSDGFK